MHDPGELRGQLKTLNNTYAARLPGESGEIETVLSLLTVMTCGKPRDQTTLRLAHGLGISSKAFGLRSLSYLAHQLETYSVRTSPV